MPGTALDIAQKGNGSNKQDFLLSRCLLSGKDQFSILLKATYNVAITE